MKWKLNSHRKFVPQLFTEINKLIQKGMVADQNRQITFIELTYAMCKKQRNNMNKIWYMHEQKLTNNIIKNWQITIKSYKIQGALKKQSKIR